MPENVWKNLVACRDKGQGQFNLGGYCNKEVDSIAAQARTHEIEAAVPEVVRIASPERTPSDIESWNLGLITAYRRELTPAENRDRNIDLYVEIRRHFGGGDTWKIPELPTLGPWTSTPT